MAKRAKFLEDFHQAVVMRMLNLAERAGWPLTAAGDQNAAKRSAQAAALAKVTGMKNGEPDVRVLLDEGRIIFFELKTEVGVLSQDQKDRHERYRELGHRVDVIKHEAPLDTALDVTAGICEFTGWPIDEWTAFAIRANSDVMKATGRAK